MSVIVIINIGFVVTDTISISDTPIQNDSIIIVSQDSTMIDCAVSSLSDNIEWTFKSKEDSVFIDKTYFATFSRETGISTLAVNANESGYYSCIINTHNVYSFHVVSANTLGM